MKSGGKSTRQEVVIGTQSESINKISSAGKTLWIFVSRLGTSVEAADLVSHLKEICGDIKLNCEELKPKYPGYRSYKVELPYSCRKTVFDSSLWPENVLVSKFFFPRPKSSIRSSLGSSQPQVNTSNFLGVNQPLAKVT